MKLTELLNKYGYLHGGHAFEATIEGENLELMLPDNTVLTCWNLVDVWLSAILGQARSAYIESARDTLEEHVEVYLRNGRLCTRVPIRVMQYIGIEAIIKEVNN